RGRGRPPSAPWSSAARGESAVWSPSVCWPCGCARCVGRVAARGVLAVWLRAVSRPCRHPGCLVLFAQFGVLPGATHDSEGRDTVAGAGGEQGGWVGGSSHLRCAGRPREYYLPAALGPRVPFSPAVAARRTSAAGRPTTEESAYARPP